MQYYQDMKAGNRILGITGMMLLVMAALLQSGCGAYYPNSVSMPMVDHKGAVNVDGGLMVSDGKVMGQTSAAYGVTSHLAVQAYAANWPNQHLQGSAGWYMPFENGSHLDVMGGYARQISDNQYTKADGNTKTYNGYHNMVFGQMDWGFAPNRAGSKAVYFTGGFSLRLGMMASTVSYKVENLDSEEVTCSDPIDYRSVVAEPMLQLGLGWRWISLNVRGGVSLLGRVDNGNMLPHYPLILGGGVTINLH